MKKLLMIFSTMFFFQVFGQNVIINSNGTHSILIDNGSTKTIVNPDGTHSTLINNINTNKIIKQPFQIISARTISVNKDLKITKFEGNVTIEGANFYFKNADSIIYHSQTSEFLIYKCADFDASGRISVKGSGASSFIRYIITREALSNKPDDSW